MAMNTVNILEDPSTGKLNQNQKGTNGAAHVISSAAIPRAQVSPVLYINGVSQGSVERFTLAPAATVIYRGVLTISPATDVIMGNRLFNELMVQSIGSNEVIIKQSDAAIESIGIIAVGSAESDGIKTSASTEVNVTAYALWFTFDVADNVRTVEIALQSSALTTSNSVISVRGFSHG